VVSDLPANPLSIELTLSHRRFWWRIDDDDEQPEHWTASADVPDREACPPPARHVGDVDLVLADLARERNLLDSGALDEWALEFIAETVIDPAEGTLHPELDAELTPGPPRMVILRWIELTEPWRGHGLGAALIAGTLRILAPNARLGACRVSPLDFPCPGDRMAAELASIRAGALLESIGFRRWRGVHVVDLRESALLDARMDLLTRWWPSHPEM
jgi:GNAT superfamily N-acetyltransferase